jgi:predicted outer membrane repeat protein
MRRSTFAAARRPLQSFFPAALLLCCTGSAYGATLVVAPDGSSSFATIQAAIDAAAPGDVIELLDGTFTGTGNRDLDPAGKAIDVRSQSGSPAACIIDCGGTSMEPHRAFIFQSGEGATTTLSGIGIVNGLDWDTGGGAILCAAGATPALRDLAFADNQAGFGGAVACLDGANATIERCTFTRNRSDFGSALGCRNASPLVRDCRFLANLPAEIGGGMLCERGAQPIVEDCQFEANRADIGAGLACRDAANPIVRRCRFVDNAANVEGGAVWCAESSPTFTECVFAGNSAGEHGGAFTCAIASPRIERCTLYGNWAPTGGGIFTWLQSAPVLHRTIIAASPQGEAVACGTDGAATLECCDLWSNAGGDWTGCIASQLADPANFAADPRFCEAAAGVLHVWSDSPCLPGLHPNGAACDGIGALGTACTAVGVTPATWGEIKSMYRD